MRRREQRSPFLLCVRTVGLAVLSALAALVGCATHETATQHFVDSDLEHYTNVSTSIQYPDVHSDHSCEIASTPPPITLEEHSHAKFCDLSLQEAVHLGLANSKVIRDLGALILQAPENVQTVHSPAIQETDSRFGVDAALSAFDAAWSTEAFFEKNDRALNNQFFGGGTRLLTQDLLSYSSQISKRAATGTELTARHNVEYDFNNAPGNNQPNLPWLTNLELEVRQPILQGANVQFNRIAGPGSIPGVYNGVLIARVNTDIGLADFEMGIRNLIGDVETAYWELYFAYRDLDAKVAARDQALETWRRIHALFVTGRKGGEAEKEAQAREQYFRFEEDVQNALSGRAQERSRATTFRGTGGVYSNERRLRLILGLPINDGCLLRPSTEPTMAKVVFPWEDILVEALTRRAELRRQKWMIKRRELEMVAAKNFLYPQLDAVGRYRWRGLGHNLLDSTSDDAFRFDNAFENMLDGDFQEWQLGFELSFPVGYRQAHAAMRNAQLQLAREHAILREQERDVAHDLSNIISEKDRAYKIAQLNLNRRVAAKEQLAALEAVYEDADESQKARLLDLLLDAQRRLADAESQYFRSLVEYMLAIKQVHYNKGSLLDYNEVYLSEGPWPEKAYRDAQQRDRLRMKSWRLENFVILRSPIVSHSQYPLNLGSPAEKVRLPAVDSHPPEHAERPSSDFEELPPGVQGPPSDGRDDHAP